jgi:RND family efflux transporter MFP subunit
MMRSMFHSWSLTAVPVLMMAVTASSSCAQDNEGYTAPFREIELAAAEPGLLVSIDVREGDEVQADSIVARLDHEVAKASLAVARQQMESVGQLRSAAAEFRLRQDRWQKLTILRGKQHASDEEVALAETEKDVAEARMLAVKEAIEVKRLEHARIKASLNRRYVRVPFTGFVTSVNKQIGEFVAATDPSVMTIVQLDPLLATFSLTPSRAQELQAGHRVNLIFNAVGSTGSAVKGTVVFVSPVINAESNSIRVKIEIPNPDYLLQAGAKCTLLSGREAPSQLGSRSLRTNDGTNGGPIDINPR